MTRLAMWALLAVVASAAAVLSFSALRDLALLCGFDHSLAWLMPVVVDAGAAAGCLVWLSGNQYQVGTGFARTLTWLLLASSVAGNALEHGLTAYQLHPTWWTVVIVSAVAPAVLGAVVHLAVLVGRGTHELRTFEGMSPIGDTDESDEIPDYWATAPYADTPGGRAAELLEQGAGRRRLARELGITEHRARQLKATRTEAAS